MNSRRSASERSSALARYLRSYMARYMHVSKNARVGSFVPAATNSYSSSMSPCRSRKIKVGSWSAVMPVRNSSSSQTRNTRSSSALKRATRWGGEGGGI